MISALNRFHGRKTIDAVYKNGRTVRGEFLSIRFLEGRKKDYRLAIVVSRKVSKKAVTRNRIRRRIYEIVRQRRKAEGKPIAYDMILSVFDDRAATIPSADLAEAVNRLLDKASR